MIYYIIVSEPRNEERFLDGNLQSSRDGGSFGMTRFNRLAGEIADALMIYNVLAMRRRRTIRTARISSIVKFRRRYRTSSASGSDTALSFFFLFLFSCLLSRTEKENEGVKKNLSRVQVATPYTRSPEAVASRYVYTPCARHGTYIHVARCYKCGNLK